MPAGNDAARRRLLKSLPKVSLHRHLEGSLRLETLVDIAQNDSIEVPARTVDDMRALVTMANRQGTRHTYLQKFNILRLFYRTPDIIHRFAYEAVADAAADNVRYMEMRFNPRALAKVGGYPFEEVADWVCDAVTRASEVHDITTCLILTMNRHESLEFGEAIAQVAVDRMERGIVGLDLAGDEGYPAKPFGPLFVMAKQAGLGVTIHAGEWTGPATVRDAIENLYADRIGHGVRTVEDSSVTRLARDRNIVFEVCPTSNLQSSVANDISQHPLRDMFYLDLITTLDVDNVCVSAVHITDEIDLVMSGQGFSLRDIKTMELNAARAAFLAEPARLALVARLEEELAEYPDTLTP